MMVVVVVVIGRIVGMEPTLPPPGGAGPARKRSDVYTYS